MMRMGPAPAGPFVFGNEVTLSGNPKLIAHIESRIAERGRIPFSEFMDAVLYHPDDGYYASDRNPIGPAGDYYTASSLDPSLGQMLAGLFRTMADGIDDFRVVEIGAGTGALARHILQAHPFPYTIVERSRSMRDRQTETLSGLGVTWSIDLPPDLRGCVFSNEFFDALPVRRYTRKDGELKELFVGAGLTEIEGEPEVAIDLPLLSEGAVADLSLSARAWMRSIARSIDAGYHLAIDYGYTDPEFYRRHSGTLMCYRQHQVDENPYADVGFKDLTAHVNFSDLIREGEAEGLATMGLVSQREFLVAQGILAMMEPLAAARDAPSFQRLQALKTLLLPPMMGDRFKVLMQRKGPVSPALPGFGPDLST